MSDHVRTGEEADAEQAVGQRLLDDLFRQIVRYNPSFDRDLVQRAFAVAVSQHRNQFRASGEDYILHPLGTATICADLRLDSATIAAALLHDVVEDTAVGIESIRAEFGDEVALLVDGVTKLTQMSFKSIEEEQAENFRKMIIAMAKDIRVILIKLADRLHNMRTLCYLGKEKQIQKAKETLEIYAPLAHRLGIESVRWELEDLAFATLHPRKYAEIQQMVAQRRADREEYLDEARLYLKRELQKVKIDAEISGRAKHFYSIYDKMTRKGKEFNEIYDLTAMRVLVGSVKDCYGALGIIHSLWKPLPGRFKDYIAMPKFNMYQSLHTTVIGPQGKPLEIQIRTNDMHETAEYGVAAHWVYKEKTRENGGPEAQLDKFQWLRQMMEWQSETKDAGEFMESLRIDLFQEEVYVFTPRGAVKSLPAGSTPIDFAYAIHTDVGHHCVGAKVNGRIVPLTYRLQSGDIVEVLTNKSAPGPSRDWLNFVQSSVRPEQDPAVVQAGAARGLGASGQGSPARDVSQAGLAGPEADGLGVAQRDHQGDAFPEARGLLRQHRGGEDQPQPGADQGDAAAERGRERGQDRPAARDRRASTTASGNGPRTSWASWSRASRTSPSGCRNAVARSPATTSSATSPWAAASPCTGGTAPTCGPSRRTPSGSLRSAGRRRRPTPLQGGGPDRGVRPGTICWRTSPARSVGVGREHRGRPHPDRRRQHRQGPVRAGGARRSGSWTPSCSASGASTRSTTPTGSPPPDP